MARTVRSTRWLVARAAGTAIENTPSSRVEAPSPMPTSTTLAKATGAPPSAVTLPVTVAPCWAIAPGAVTSAARNNVNRRIRCLIRRESPVGGPPWLKCLARNAPKRANVAWNGGNRHVAAGTHEERRHTRSTARRSRSTFAFARSTLRGGHDRTAPPSLVVAYCPCCRLNDRAILRRQVPECQRETNLPLDPSPCHHGREAAETFYHAGARRALSGNAPQGGGGGGLTVPPPLASDLMEKTSTPRARIPAL